MFKALKTSYRILLGIVIVLIIFRLMLPSIVKNYVNKVLNELPGYTGHVEDIDIRLLQGAYAIDGLVLKKRTDTSSYPFLLINHTDLSVEWKQIFKGRLVGEVILDRPSIHILAETADLSKEPSKEHWTETLQDLMPLTINRLEITNGKFTYLDRSSSPDIDLHIDSMRLTALNLANVEDSSSTKLPSTVSLSGTSIGQGHLKVDMKVNVLKEIPDFDMNMQLTSVNLTSLNNFIKAQGKFDVERGNLDIYSELELMDGELNGYVKPFIENIKVLDWKNDNEKEEGGILNAAKEAVIGLFSKVVENPEREQIATTVPIQGNVNNPKTNGWATFLGILKNAFIEALNRGIEGSVK
jgi:hypothetical protein